MQLLVEIEQLHDGPFGQRWTTVTIEQPTTVRLEKLTHRDVDEEWLPRHREPVPHDLTVLDFPELLGSINELIPGLRYAQSFLCQEVSTVDKHGESRRVADAISASLPPTETAKGINEVVLAERFDEVVEGTEQAIGRKRHTRDGLTMRGVRRSADGKRNRQFLLQLAPG